MNNAGKVVTPPWRMFLISVATLYIELFLIRWAGTEVRIFAYIQNILLITCFLGFGVGCLQSAKPASVIKTLASFFALVILICLPIITMAGIHSDVMNNFMSEASDMLTLSSDSALWGGMSRASTPDELVRVIRFLLAAAMVGFMLYLVATMMVPLGQWVGYYFDNSKTVLRAYSINLFGSLVGTWLLLVLTWLRLPPVFWVIAAFVFILAATPLTRKDLMKGGALLAGTLAIMLLFSGPPSIWSPYQKLQVRSSKDNLGYEVMVNNIGYMSMGDTRSSAVTEKYPDFAAKLHNSVYDSPFRFLPQGANVLIVGAGAGNDASAALRNGAAHVDAVEIDPVIYELGRKMHPDQPYTSDKVNVIINDARNFMRESTQRYDAVIFGLLDSHTEVSGYSNMRIDNYVYTKESFEQARRLLKPDGVLVLKFEVRYPWTWMGQRFYRILSEVFEREPILYFAPKASQNIWPGTVFITSNGDSLWKRAQEPELKKFVADHPASFTPDLKTAPPVTSDDWPYVYNRDRSVPTTYFTVSAILIALALFMVRRSFFIRERQTWTPFLLGAGFMLMETQLISRLALYFGSTWIVSGIAISVVLCMLMLANVLIDKGVIKTRSLTPYYAVLVLSLLGNYFFPWETLPYSSFAVGSMLALAYAVSVFMAGIIFTSIFHKAQNKSKTLGANVIGAVFGGVLQNMSFIFGLKALIIIAACCYIGAGVFMTPVKSRR